MINDLLSDYKEKRSVSTRKFDAIVKLFTGSEKKFADAAKECQSVADACVKIELEESRKQEAANQRTANIKSELESFKGAITSWFVSKMQDVYNQYVKDFTSIFDSVRDVKQVKEITKQIQEHRVKIDFPTEFIGFNFVYDENKAISQQFYNERLKALQEHYVPQMKTKIDVLRQDSLKQCNPDFFAQLVSNQDAKDKLNESMQERQNEVQNDTMEEIQQQELQTEFAQATAQVGANDPVLTPKHATKFKGKIITRESVPSLVQYYIQSKEFFEREIDKMETLTVKMMLTYAEKRKNSDDPNLFLAGVEFKEDTKAK
jgi:hypothetical protein